MFPQRAALRIPDAFQETDLVIENVLQATVQRWKTRQEQQEKKRAYSMHQDIRQLIETQFTSFGLRAKRVSSTELEQGLSNYDKLG